MSSKKKILITGGGTGGHVMPALAVMDIIQSLSDTEILYVGGYRGIENQVITKLNIPFKRLWISGFARGEWLRNILFPVKLVVSLMQALLILLRDKPVLVIGTGGYVTGPMVYVASLLAVKTFIIEQDVYPGITSRLLARMVDLIFVANEEARAHFRNVRPDKIIVSGNPIRSSINPLPRTEACEKLGLDDDKLVLAILGGSQGARFINQSVLRIWKKLAGHNIQFIWQTGKLDYDQVRDQLPDDFPGVVAPFMEDMAAVYSAADAALCRSGAITLAELAHMKLPSILIPYPAAAGDHQRKNAEKFVQLGVARMLEQSENDFDAKLLELVHILMLNSNIREEMKRNWEKARLPDAQSILREEIVKGLN